MCSNFLSSFLFFRSRWVQLWIDLDHLVFLAVAPENSLSGLASRNGARSTRAERMQSRDFLGLSVAETKGAPSTSPPTYLLGLFVFPSSQTGKWGKESTRRKKRVSCSSFPLLWSQSFFQVPIFCSSFVWSPICPCLLEKGTLGPIFIKFALLLVSGYQQLAPNAIIANVASAYRNQANVFVSCGQKPQVLYIAPSLQKTSRSRI
jgi:hypothetical protein